MLLNFISSRLANGLAVVLSTLLVVSVFISGASAAVSIDRIPNERLFALQFPGGLAFYGVVNRITSVSVQEYISGPYLVTEMVVDISTSPSQLRIYVTETHDPAAMLNRATGPTGLGATSGGPAQAAAERARRVLSATTEDVVVKDYPIATHAKTIEYRLSSRDNLLDLFETFIHLWDGTGIDVVKDNEVQSLNGLGGVRIIVSGD